MGTYYNSATNILACINNALPAEYILPVDHLILNGSHLHGYHKNGQLMIFIA